MMYCFLFPCPVDENLDVVDESNNHNTISGSLCVENIRKRLPEETERRMIALIRSANDSSSDVAIYNARAHGFLAKQPIKHFNVKEVLAPLWLQRFPESEFGESIATNSRHHEAETSTEDVACTPYDIAQKVSDIESLFEKNTHSTNPHLIHDEIHELKGDLLTLNSNSSSVTSVIGQINLIQVTKAPLALAERWRSARDNINEIIQSMQKQMEKSFRIPTNTFALAIDDSKIQRKLLMKFFTFMGVPPENSIICGESVAEIKGFVDMAVKLMHEHATDYGMFLFFFSLLSLWIRNSLIFCNVPLLSFTVFMIVDENLDVVDECGKSISVSGSQCVEQIRQKLPPELEKRMLALVRSANDSKGDIGLYHKRAHGFLPKAVRQSDFSTVPFYLHVNL